MPSNADFPYIVPTGTIMGFEKNWFKLNTRLSGNEFRKVWDSYESPCVLGESHCTAVLPRPPTIGTKINYPLADETFMLKLEGWSP